MQIAVLCFLFYSRTLERPFSFFFFVAYIFIFVHLIKENLKGKRTTYN